MTRTHPLPNQLGEGKPGSGLLIRWSEPQATTDRAVIHAIAVDDPGSIAGWHLKGDEREQAVLKSPGARKIWKLTVDPVRLALTIQETVAGRKRVVERDVQGTWRLK